MNMGTRVSDLTTDAIGKIYRIQNDDGAYIEGTLEAVTFGVVGESKVPEVIVSFRELKTSYRENAKRTPIPIYTRPQHSAVEVEEKDFVPEMPQAVRGGIKYPTPDNG